MKGPYCLLISVDHRDPLGFAKRVSSAFASQGGDVVCVTRTNRTSEVILDGMRIATGDTWSLWLKLRPGGAYDRVAGDHSLIESLLEKGAV